MTPENSPGIQPERISSHRFWNLVSGAAQEGQAVNRDALRDFKPQVSYTPEEAEEVLARLLGSPEIVPLNNVLERSLISPITTEGRSVETESDRRGEETRLPTPKFAIENLAEKVVNLWANTQTTISVTWLEARKERTNRRWEKTMALITDRKNRLGQIRALYEEDFRRVTPSENLPPVGTAEYDRQLLLFARGRIAEVAVIDSMGRAAENVGEHFAHLKQAKGMAQVDKQELPSLVEEIKEVLPKRIELCFLRAREVVGTKLALGRGTIVAVVEEASETVVAFFKSGVVLSPLSGSLVGSGIALARGILEVKTIAIHAGLGAGFAFVSYLLLRKFTDQSSDKKKQLKGQGSEDVQILPG